jgi:hypothetical protein
MNAKEWNALKVGDEVYHKDFGRCKVLKFSRWHEWSSEQEEKKDVIHIQQGEGTGFFIVTKKRLLSKTPFKKQKL